MPLLDIKDLVFRTVDRTILDGISLAIEPSEVLSLLGANGTGKSTEEFLRALCDLCSWKSLFKNLSGFYSRTFA